jgi:hypothetical protein
MQRRTTNIGREGVGREAVNATFRPCATHRAQPISDAAPDAVAARGITPARAA